MQEWRNAEARAYNRCCSGKAINITYTWCVFVVLSIQHAMCVHRNVICGLPGSAEFFHIISCRGTGFEKNKLGVRGVYFDLLYTFFLKQFSF